MKNKILSLSLILFISFLFSCSLKPDFEVGQVYNGFKLLEKKFVKEVNADCFYFIHEKSGAKLLKIAADDANKLFNIAFKTAPEHDYGTPHIMEHSVLNGSKNFPVKSPFDVLVKGSLNTFLNAMTGDDVTTYPVASMNDKDYFNLMHVYLDAVFNPLLHEDPRILKQEGWHYELDDIDGEIVYKGVVYNEMKGAFSSAETELDYQVNKNLFPDNTYGVSSGGYPAAIPGLDYEYFKDFHNKYYHPSNSYTLLYGNADLNKELQFIDLEYFSKYEKSDEKIEITLQKPFENKKVAEAYYSVQEGESTKDKTYLSLNFVSGLNINQELVLALRVLSEALINHESAPIRLALQEASIGKEVSAYASTTKQNVFNIQVQNANAEDKEKFEEIVYSTLQKIVKEGFDKKTIDGIINRIEFSLREGNTPHKGIMYTMMSYKGWFFADNPFLGLEFEKPLKNVKEGIQKGLLEKIVQEYFIDNPHTLLMVLKPKPGLEKEISEKVKTHLAEYKKSLSKEELEELVAETKALKEYQEKEDTPEALATIPMIELSDISKDVKWYDIEEKKVSNIPVLYHPDFTSNILYAKLLFNLKSIPKELLPYASLLNELLPLMNTENYTFGELDNALNTHTGGFNTWIDNYTPIDSQDEVIPFFVLSSKAFTEKSEQLFELSSEIINKSKLNDVERLKDVLTRHQSKLESEVRNYGLYYAMDRLRSYYSNGGVFKELTEGFDYYNFVTDISQNFESKNKEVIEKLKKTADLLFTQKNMVASVTCSKEQLVSFEKSMQNFISSIPEGTGKTFEWKFETSIKNEGFMSASKVQYVVKGYNLKKLGYNWNGKLSVLNKIMSREYLNKQIRVIGGAYGGFSNIYKSGDVIFASYRDPNLKETLENYNKTPEFIKELDIDNTEMTRFIIGTISDIDYPTTASSRGSIALRNYFTNTTLEDLKKERNDVLTTSIEDVKSFEKLINDVVSQDIICVYGNEDKIKENKDLFKTTLKVIN